jgi:hypothetical protein
MVADGLTETDVIAAIVSATAVHKVLRSRSPRRSRRGERLYVIMGLTLQGIPLYTKGTIRRVDGSERFFILISAKRAIQ